MNKKMKGKCDLKKREKAWKEELRDKRKKRENENERRHTENDENMEDFTLV